MPLLWKSPQPGSPSMHTHLVTACFPYFPTIAEVGGCSSEAWPYQRGRHTTLPFLNCKIVCKIIFKIFRYFITNKHRCHPLFSEKEAASLLPARYTKSHRIGTAEWAGTQDSSCFPAWGHAQGLNTQCLPWCFTLLSSWSHAMRGKRVRSHQDHSKTLQRLQSNLFFQITFKQV